jgi:phosphoribosylglycinamide formyltransferase-1
VPEKDDPGSRFGGVRTAVLASGSGTLLDAILEDGIPVALVVTDRPSKAQVVAETHGVPAVLVERASFGAEFDRDAYTAQVVEVLQAHDVELVVMAGYGTIFGEAIHAAFPDRILNTHPALLPSFKGWHAVRDALAFGVKVTGCTVHVATLEVDAGPILAQEAVPVLPDDDEEALHERIKAVERRLYPQTIRAVLADPSILQKEDRT